MEPASAAEVPAAAFDILARPGHLSPRLLVEAAADAAGDGGLDTILLRSFSFMQQCFSMSVLRVACDGIFAWLPQRA